MAIIYQFLRIYSSRGDAQTPRVWCNNRNARTHASMYICMYPYLVCVACAKHEKSYTNISRGWVMMLCAFAEGVTVAVAACFFFPLLCRACAQEPCRASRNTLSMRPRHARVAYRLRFSSSPVVRCWTVRAMCVHVHSHIYTHVKNNNHKTKRVKIRPCAFVWVGRTRNIPCG